jgi:uncharacterized hydrophobic protein (TIGR00271 family)
MFDKVINSLANACKRRCIKVTAGWKKVTAGWRPYLEQTVPLEELDASMMSASIPSFGYFFMLLLSAVIASFGLLSNSAPAIIGAMIIAPLMAPIVSFAYSIDVFDWKLARRSFLTILTGVLLVIVFSYLSTRFIGLRIAGSEILSRTSPTLLDLGIAMAAGAAAGFSYTRKSINSSIAGVAIAVALVPPLAVTGIGLAYGRLAASEVGLSLTELGHYSGGIDIAKGSFILFVTNLLGIIFVACLILLSQGYGQWKRAGAGLLAVLVLSIVIINPLQKALYKLTVKSEVLALLVSLPQKFPHMFSGQGRIDAIHVNYQGDFLHVDIEGVVPKKALDPKLEGTEERLQSALDLFQDELQQTLKVPIIVELELIPVDILNARSGDEHMDPVGFIEPDELEENSLNSKSKK